MHPWGRGACTVGHENSQKVEERTGQHTTDPSAGRCDVVGLRVEALFGPLFGVCLEAHRPSALRTATLSEPHGAKQSRTGPHAALQRASGARCHGDDHRSRPVSGDGFEVVRAGAQGPRGRACGSTVSRGGEGVDVGWRDGMHGPGVCWGLSGDGRRLPCGRLRLPGCCRVVGRLLWEGEGVVRAPWTPGDMDMDVDVLVQSAR